MLLIVGLGNPGDTHENTRHNVGFLVLDALQKNYDLPDFKLDKKPNALTSKGMLGEQQILLAKPQTFMNNSGEAIKALYTKYKLQETRYIIVIHDDIDLPLGKVRISMDSGSAGHRGINSIIQHLGSKEFIRIRIGIQPQTGKPHAVEEFVLRNFTPEEMLTVQDIIRSIVDAPGSIVAEGIEKAMNRFNQ